MFTRIARLFTFPARAKPAATVPLQVERLEDRSVPAFLAPVVTAGGGVTVAIGDFNHDGRDDVASINGTFQGSNPVSVVAGNKVSVTLSNGDGTFRPAGQLSVPAKGYYLGAFLASDVNGDGRLDLTAVTIDKKVQYVPNVIDGGPGGYYLYTLHVTRWLGNGDGTFGKPSVQTIDKDRLAPSLGDSSYLFVDVNRDGLLDYVSLNSASSNLAVYLKNADDTYYHEAGLYSTPHPDWVGAGDFNGDGWVDIIVINSQTSASPTYSVLLNDRHW
jgi:hypothetical protein